jgi:hypothetical protein
MRPVGEGRIRLPRSEGLRRLMRLHAAVVATFRSVASGVRRAMMAGAY